MMCWIALDRAVRLGDAGHLPASNADLWRREAGAIRQFVEERCWSSERRTYVRYPGSAELDASLLVPILMGYGGERRRLAGTVERLREELGLGPLLYRYLDEDGLPGREGAFLACSFWLVDALARLGRHDAASVLMGQLIPLANDVGLYAEEIDPGSGAFLGNFPQGLVHLALVNAALTLEEEAR
jgi:GH15 family glucan-1,4-alpha-glucosidase